MNSLISPYWKPIAINLVYKIDDSKRIKYLPKWLSRIITNYKGENIIESITVSYGELKVRGTFAPRQAQIIKETQDYCKTVCQGCGKENPTRVVFKSWVHHYCKKCENDITTRYNTSN